MTTPNTPVVNKGLLYVTGLTVSAGALNADLLSSATLLISSGQGRDSTDINDIVLPATVAPGAANPNNVPVDANAPFYTLNAATVGVNGLDVGALVATTKYAVYAIASSNSTAQPATLLSASFTQPLLPLNYDMFRRIGTVMTNAAGTRILNFHQRGNGSFRDTWYAVPFATAVAAGASATFAPVTLTTWVPTTGGEVYILSALTSDAGATRTVVYSADAGTTIAAAASAGEVIMSSPASTVTSASLKVPVTTAAGVQTIQYAVSNAAAAVAVSVQGFVDFL